ncbi:cupin domain-containing protein [Pseudothermotoga sp.]|nr:cupin domain-containing protein [Pseudothermotoga sp.]MDW8140528.1 cupin domain-containing protein [Pseudothermotoga sp.]
MKVVRAWEEKGVEVPEPYRRIIKVLFAPDKEGVNELLFSIAIIPPGSKTDYHSHDRPELMYIVSGQGICVTENGEIPITEDMALWAPAGEKHQFVNTGYVPLKLATAFVPPYTAGENYNRALKAAKNKE